MNAPRLNYKYNDMVIFNKYIANILNNHAQCILCKCIYSKAINQLFRQINENSYINSEQDNISFLN